MVSFRRSDSFSTMSIAPRVAGICSASMPAASSTITSDEASSGSMKPLDRPTATQLRCQPPRRKPGLMVMRGRVWMSASRPPLATM